MPNIKCPYCDMNNDIPVGVSGEKCAFCFAPLPDHAPKV